jgi:hypothetical protein
VEFPKSAPAVLRRACVLGHASENELAIFTKSNQIEILLVRTESAALVTNQKHRRKQ